MIAVGQHPQVVDGTDSPAVAREFEVIVDRIQRSYPEMGVTDIRIVVHDAAHGFERARLQQFVPLLVEKIARDECRRRGRQQPGIDLTA